MFNYQPQLQGQLLELRPLTAEDWEPLFAVACDPLIWELHPQRNRFEAPVFRSFFEEGLASGGALVAVDRATGGLIGSSRYSQKYAQRGEIEIGWTFLARSHWGGRYNQEMKQLMLSHALRDFDAVIFRIGEHNSRSRRAIEKLGAALTDRVQQTVVGDVVTTHVCYVMTRQIYAGWSVASTPPGGD